MSIGWHVPIVSGQSIQRLITSGGLSYHSEDPGSLVGNPLFSQYRASYSVQVTRPDASTYIALNRWTTVGPLTEANVTPTSAHRTTTWNWPWDFFTFDADIRQRGGTNTAVDISIGIVSVSEQDQALLAQWVTGSLLFSFLVSSPLLG